MANPETILCPIDLSSVSRRALEYAVGLGDFFHATLHALQVVDTALPASGLEAIPYELSSQTRRELLDNLKKFVKPFRSSRTRMDVTLAEGRVTEQILKAAEALRADLIVMGTHGRGGFDRFLLGSVTEHVVRKAVCPVLAVPPGERGAAPGTAFRTIICAVDFAPASIRAVDYAQLLTAQGGRLILVHSVGWPFGEGTEAMPPEVQALRRSLESEAVGRLHRAATAGARTDIFLQEAVTAGKAYAHILRCAREESADLIVMGLHSHMTNQLALLGSTTHHVLCEAPCPVLTVSDRPAMRALVTSEHPSLAFSA